MQCSLNPYADYAYDGLFLNPLEVVFVKVKRFQREANWGSARLADAYSGWMDQEVRLIACFTAGLSTVVSIHMPPALLLVQAAITWCMHSGCQDVKVFIQVGEYESCHCRRSQEQ